VLYSRIGSKIIARSASAFVMPGMRSGYGSHRVRMSNFVSPAGKWLGLFMITTRMSLAEEL